jgi:glycosyltransferase involved in cell wall biosynthesis
MRSLRYAGWFPRAFWSICAVLLVAVGPWGGYSTALPPAPTHVLSGSALPVLSDLTIGIKTFGRPELVKRLIVSIRESYDAQSEIQILVADDGGTDNNNQHIIDSVNMLIGQGKDHYIMLDYDAGLSAGRNALVASTKTKFFMLMDDDFVFKSREACNLGDMLSMLHRWEDSLDLVGGKIGDRPDNFARFGYYKDGLVLYYDHSGYVAPPSSCVYVEFVPNFFMAKTKVLADVKWDDALKLGEHEDFFYRFRQHGYRASYCRDMCHIEHAQAQTSEAYKAKRGRAVDFLELSMKKHKFSFLAYYKPEYDTWSCYSFAKQVQVGAGQEALAFDKNAICAEVKRYLRELERKDRVGRSGALLPASTVKGERESFDGGESALDELKIYIYDLPGEFQQDIVDFNQNHLTELAEKHSMGTQEIDCLKNMFSLEYWVPRYLSFSKYVTRNPEEATLFYVPAYTVCQMNNHLPHDFVMLSKFHEKLMRHIKSKPYWKRKQGRDHVFMFSQGYGARLWGPTFAMIQNSLILSVNGDTYLPPPREGNKPPQQIIGPGSEGKGGKTRFTGKQAALNPFRPWHDIVVPVKPLVAFSQFAQKTMMVYFQGAVKTKDLTYSYGTRQYIMDHFAQEPGWFLKQRTSVLDADLMNEFKLHMEQSVFCLCPEGFHAFTPRVVEAIHAACIPVIIGEGYQLPFEHFIDYREFAVFVSRVDVPFLPSILSSVSQAKRTYMQGRMAIAAQQLTYSTEGVTSRHDAMYYLLRQLAAYSMRMEAADDGTYFLPRVFTEFPIDIYYGSSNTATFLLVVLVVGGVALAYFYRRKVLLLFHKLLLYITRRGRKRAYSSNV